MHENEISKIIILSAINIHQTLGPELLENAYQECLFYELQNQNLHVIKEKPMPLTYKEVTMDCGYKIDLLVENKVLIALKSVDKLTDMHTAQAMTYMKLGGYKLGLLINFNVSLLKSGLKRLINGQL